MKKIFLVFMFLIIMAGTVFGAIIDDGPYDTGIDIYANEVTSNLELGGFNLLYANETGYIYEYIDNSDYNIVDFNSSNYIKVYFEQSPTYVDRVIIKHNSDGTSYEFYSLDNIDAPLSYSSTSGDYFIWYDLLYDKEYQDGYYHNSNYDKQYLSRYFVYSDTPITKIIYIIDYLVTGSLYDSTFDYVYEPQPYLELSPIGYYGSTVPNITLTYENIKSYELYISNSEYGMMLLKEGIPNGSGSITFDDISSMYFINGTNLLEIKAYDINDNYVTISRMVTWDSAELEPPSTTPTEPIVIPNPTENIKFLSPLNNFSDNQIPILTTKIWYKVETDSISNVSIDFNNYVNGTITNTQTLQDGSTGYVEQILDVTTNWNFGTTYLNASVSVNDVLIDTTYLTVTRYEDFIDENNDGIDDRTGQDEYSTPIQYDDGIGTIEGALTNFTNLIPNFQNFTNLVANIFNWLPAEIYGLIVFALALGLILRIVGRS